MLNIGSFLVIVPTLLQGDPSAAAQTAQVATKDKPQTARYLAAASSHRPAPTIVYDFADRKFLKRPHLMIDRTAYVAIYNMNRLRYTAQVEGKDISVGTSVPSILTSASLAGGGADGKPAATENVKDPKFVEARKALDAAQDLRRYVREIYATLYAAERYDESLKARMADVAPDGLFLSKEIKTPEYSDSLFDKNKPKPAAIASEKGIVPDDLVPLTEAVIRRLESAKDALPRSKANGDDAGANQPQDPLAKEGDALAATITTLLDAPLIAEAQRAAYAWTLYRTPVPDGGQVALFTPDLFPVTPRGDVLELSIKITGGGESAPSGGADDKPDKDGREPDDASSGETAAATKGGVNLTERIPVDIPLGGLKIDYSVGLLGTSLTDQKYRAVGTTTGTGDNAKTTYNVTSYRDDWSVQPIALIHFNFYRSPSFGLNFQVGASVKGEKNVGYLLGFGTTFGYDRRIGLNFGLLFQSVDRLNVATGVELPSKDDLARQTMMSRPYIGLTYAFK